MLRFSSYWSETFKGINETDNFVITGRLCAPVVLVEFIICPQEYSVMFPKEIKEAAEPYINRKDVQKMKLFLS